MPAILRKLPFFDRASSFLVPGGAVSILPYQVALSVSLASEEEQSLHPRTPRFPAILDTGFNNTFVLQEQHLNAWAGLRREHLHQVGQMTVHGKKVPVFRAAVWLHPNVPGKREDIPGRKAFCIHLAPGIAICPPGMTEPRLPLLGMRALAAGDLQMAFRWRAFRFSQRTTPWWYSWLFG